jgi:prepilin signal peptidase PulO-like enzyme (type II secretory pathway)
MPGPVSGRDDTMAHPDTRSGIASMADGPGATWAFMVAALVAVFLLPDWAGTGVPRPLWVFAMPVLLGLIGAGIALKAMHPWWAVLSAVWGFALVQVLIWIITLLSGP